MKSFIGPLFLFAISASCFIAFKLIGTEIDAAGFLQEPFYLLPVGYSFLLFALIAMSVEIIKQLKARRCRL